MVVGWPGTDLIRSSSIFTIINYLSFRQDTKIDLYAWMSLLILLMTITTIFSQDSETSYDVLVNRAAIFLNFLWKTRN